MNKIQESLEANMAEILSAIPADMRDEAKKNLATEVTNTTEPAALSGNDEVSAIKAELAANPAVDETAAAAELKDIKAPSL